MHYIFVVLFVDLLAFTLILPVQPSLFNLFSLDQARHNTSELHDVVHWLGSLTGAPLDKSTGGAGLNTVLLGGLVNSLFFLLQCISAPFWGALSDFYGRKPIVLFSLVSSMLSYGIWAMSTNITMFIVSRIILGLGRSIAVVISAAVHDLYTPSCFSIGMGLIGASFSLSFTLGPLMGVMLVNYLKSSFTGGEASMMPLYTLFPGCIALSFDILAFLIAVFLMPESLKKKTDVAPSWSTLLRLSNPLAQFQFSRSLEKRDQLRSLGFILFCYSALMSGFESTIVFYTDSFFGYSASDQGKMFGVIGIIMTVVQGFGLRWLSRRPTHSDISASLTGLAIMVPALYFMGAARSDRFLFFCGLTLFSISSSVVIPSLNAAGCRCGAKSADAGQLSGTLRALGWLGRAFGPIIVGTFYWRFGARNCYLLGACVFSCLSVLAHAFFWNIPRRLSSTPSSNDINATKIKSN